LFIIVEEIGVNPNPFFILFCVYVINQLFILFLLVSFTV